MPRRSTRAKAATHAAASPARSPPHHPAPAPPRHRTPPRMSRPPRRSLAHRSANRGAGPSASHSTTGSPSAPTASAAGPGTADPSSSTVSPAPGATRCASAKALGVRTRCCRWPRVPFTDSSTRAAATRLIRDAEHVDHTRHIGVTAGRRENRPSHREHAVTHGRRERGHPLHTLVPRERLTAHRERLAIDAHRGTQKRRPPPAMNSGPPANSIAARAPRCSMPRAWIEPSAGWIQGTASQ